MQSRRSKIATDNHLKIQARKKNVLNPLANNPYYREVMSYLCTTDIISKTSVLTKWNYCVLLLDVSMNKIMNDLIEKEFGSYLFESGRDILHRVEHYHQIQNDGNPWLVTNTNNDYDKSKRLLVPILNKISRVLEKRNQYEKVYYLYNFFTNHKRRYNNKFKKYNKNKNKNKNRKNGRKVILSLSSDILKENGIVEDRKSHQPFITRQFDCDSNINTLRIATKRTIIKCLFISMYKSINNYKNNNNNNNNNSYSKNFGIAFDKYVSLYNINCMEEEKFVFNQMQYFQWSFAYGVIGGNNNNNNNNNNNHDNNSIGSDKVYVYGVDDQDQKNWAYCTKSLIQRYLSDYLIENSNQFYRQFLKQCAESCLSLNQFGCYEILNPNIILGELLLDLITYTLDNHFNRWINDDDDDDESESESDINDDDFNFDFCDKTTDYLSIYGNNFVTDIASFAKFENKYYQFKETVQEILQKSKSGKLKLKLKLETADTLIIKMDLIKCNFDTIHNKWHQFFDSIFEAFETEDDVKKMQKDMRNDIKSVLEFEDFFSTDDVDDVDDVDDIEYINRYLPKDIQPMY